MPNRISCQYLLEMETLLVMHIYRGARSSNSEDLADLGARCGDDVVRLASARAAVAGFPRRLLPIKQWLLTQPWALAELGEAFVRCAPGMRELYVFDRNGIEFIRVAFRDSLDSIDDCVWRLMHDDQRPAAVNR